MKSVKRTLRFIRRVLCDIQFLLNRIVANSSLSGG